MLTITYYKKLTKIANVFYKLDFFLPILEINSYFCQSLGKSNLFPEFKKNRIFLSKQIS